MIRSRKHRSQFNLRDHFLGLRLMGGIGHRFGHLTEVRVVLGNGVV
jgi:hypothetical protein